MARKTPTVRDLASRAGMEVEDALLKLWGAGINRFTGPTERVSLRSLAAVERALGLSPYTEQTTVDYWTTRLGVTREELAQTLRAQGLSLPPLARRLPKGALRRLRHHLAPPAPAVRVTTPVPNLELPPLQWEAIGHIRDLHFLTLEDVEHIHMVLEEDFSRSADPIEPRGLRDRSLLESAANRPMTSIGSEVKYPTVEMSASALFHSLIHNHPFHNGNKRTALVALLVLLDRNEFVLTCSQSDLFRRTLATAQHALIAPGASDLADREVAENSRWLRSHVRPIDRTERVIKWLKLRQLLRERGCEIAMAQGAGNRLNITRSIHQQRILGLPPRVTVLRTQVQYSGDGSEAQRSTVHKIRKDLHLDDEHGCDSSAFYSEVPIDTFIVEYRRVLTRLAKL